MPRRDTPMRRLVLAAALCAAAAELNNPAVHDLLAGLSTQDVPGFLDRYANTDFRPEQFPATPVSTGPTIMANGPVGTILVQSPDLPADRRYVVNVQEMESGRVMRSVFLRAGEHEEVRLPAGAYALSVMTGTRWFGVRDMFGLETRAERVMVPFQIEAAGGRANSFTVDLTRDAEGNMPMRRVSALAR